MHVLSGVIGSAAPYAKTAAGTAGAAGAVGAGAFKYNRANYMFDNELRFGRYTSGYSFAIDQAAMYREDIRDMTALTVTKQDLYHIVGVIFLVLNFQLIMAGRLGVHGPAPPGWQLGLYWCNSTISLMFLVFYTWLSMHASARAQAGGAHMLTRKVRLPIPTPKQLDKARKTGNSFERTRATDMFRVPFVAPAPKQDLEAGSDESDAGKKATSSGAGKERKIPRWYQNDEMADLHASDNGAAPTTPEHFELYRGLQQEWWGHDVYARIGMLLFMSHWLTAAAIYTQCHAFGELRAMWPAWSCSLLFCAANRAILKTDIIVDSLQKSFFSVPIELAVPWVPMISVLGMSLDYSVIKPTTGWQAVIYVIGWICYVIQGAWCMRLLDICAPQHMEDEQPEAPGQPWWPKEWYLPPAFQQCVYLVAPPKRLEPGQSCLQQEMKAAKGRGATSAPPKKGRETMPALWAWKLFRGALLTATGMWAFMSIGRIVEHINGERQFLKQEGRVMRWPSHMQPWMAPWSRLGTRNEWCHTGGCDRRLMGVEEHHHVDMSAKAARLTSLLTPLAEGLSQSRSRSSEPAAHVQTFLKRVDMAWNSKQQPAVLASHSNGAAVVLSPSLQGVLMNVKAQTAPSAFTLGGLEGFGNAIGASWGDAGLLLASASGMVAECTGLPVGESWRCHHIDAKLPLGGSALVTATVARNPHTRALWAAVAFEGEESNIVVFRQGVKEWLPAGEVQMPISGRVPALSMSGSADEILASTGTGNVLKWALDAAEPVLVAAPQATDIPSEKMWHAVSSCGGNCFAHLSSSRNQGRGWTPEIIVSSH